MRTWRGGAVVLALTLGVACANRDNTASTPATGGAQAGGAQAGGAQAGGAQAGGAQAGAGAAGAPAAQPAGARGTGAATQVTAKMAPEQLDAAMKSIQQSVGSLQKNLKGNMLMEAAKDGQQLATLFGDVERFWQQHNVDEAVKLSQAARAAASDAASAAAAGDQMKAMTATTSLFGTCKQCHTNFREGDAATGFRITAGVIK